MSTVAAPAIWYVGVMSGTSFDGIDAVLADFSGHMPRVVGHCHHSYPGDLRATLRSLCVPGADEIEMSGRTAQWLAELYSATINELLASCGVAARDVKAVGVHGQTVRHRPDLRFSLQLNAPARIAELTGIDVVADFRSRDLAAGGQGAPLVPAFHARVFAGSVGRAVVNIGGISNITWLAPSPQPVIGFDCGPGNVFLDLWAERHQGLPFDRDGRFAASGRVDNGLLARLLAEPFFALPPPKSTGRELFSEGWLNDRIAGTSLAPEDVQATLVGLTAGAIADAVARWCVGARELVVCGGGARNPALMAALARAVPSCEVRSSAALGLEPEHVEATAFAWLARAHCER
ncbi:MAG: anhydro-N-acetylmuramic acid kinase, partial [Burkholderiaceae bacterium]